MAGLGNEQSMMRDNLHRFITRKSGDPPMKRVSRGGAEMHALLHHQLNSLPEVHLPRVQDANGLFPAMAGWDYPQP